MYVNARRSMDTDKEKIDQCETTTQSLEIKKYFQCSQDNDIFDQISKSNLSNENKEGGSTTTTTTEPVICRVFAANDDHLTFEKNARKMQQETFFDLLGTTTTTTNTRYSTTTPFEDCNYQINKCSQILTTLSPEFPSEGSFFSPSSGTDIDSDTISDELFMKGATTTTTTTTSIHHVPDRAAASGEVDRRRDAWIPSNRTRLALITLATTSGGGGGGASYALEKDLLTMPGVVLQEDMFDNVYEVVNHYLGDSEANERKVLTLNDVTQDERGLRELIQAECYRSAVNLTSRLLTMYGQGIGRAGYSSKHTLHSIQLWFTRIALLVKLRSWSVAWAESEPWWNLDRPDLYFQFYSELYGGRPGTIVPFSFRLLLAELPQYVHKPQEAFKRLFSVLGVVRKIIKNLNSGLSEDGSFTELSNADRQESKQLWFSREIRVIHSIINLCLQQRQYRLAIKILYRNIENPNIKYSAHYYRTLMSALGRIFLQMGDLRTAVEWFEKSRSFKNKNVGTADSQELIDNGLLAVANNNYEKAYEYFQKASLKDSSNIMLKNNMAVSLLYCGKQEEAITLLESAITTNPIFALHENLLLNLCTLYELENSSSIVNKHKILKMVSKYKGDSISLNCLKLQIKE